MVQTPLVLGLDLGTDKDRYGEGISQCDYRSETHFQMSGYIRERKDMGEEKCNPMAIKILAFWENLENLRNQIICYRKGPWG